MTQKSTSPQANISEFNTITGLVFTPVDLNRAAIESAMGAAFSSGSTNILQSGRPFTEVFAHSLAWLSNKGYVRSAGPLPYEKVTLTTKGLAALNAKNFRRRSAQRWLPMLPQEIGPVLAI